MAATEPLGALLYQLGFDLPALRDDMRAIEREFEGLTETAKRTFGDEIGRQLALGFDSDAATADLTDIRQGLDQLGANAKRVFDQAFGRQRARGLFDPIINVTEDAVSRLNVVLRDVGIDLPAFRSDTSAVANELQGLSNTAKRAFGRNLGREIANSIDPRLTANELDKIKRELAVFGKDAQKVFEQTFSRRRAKAMFDPIRDETKTFVGQLKAQLAQGFSFKNLALGSAAGIGLASLASNLLSAGKAAIQFSADFELALAKVQAIADEDFNVPKVSNDIKRLAQQVPQDLISLTKGLGDIIGAGISEASSALNVLEVSAKAAVAGLTDTGTASRGIVFVLNAYGKSAEEAAAISDVLFKTVDEGVITFEELTSQIGDVVGPAAQAGVDISEVGAAIAFLTKQGIGGAEAVTALRNLITRIIDPAESAKKAAKELGIELSLAGVKAAGGFTQFIKQIQDATKGDIVAIQKIFPEERAFRAASRLAGEVGIEFQRLSSIFGDTSKTAGATEKAFRIINETADQQWKLLKNNLSVAVVNVGSNILNSLTPAIKAMNDAFAHRNELDKTIERLRQLGVEQKELTFFELHSASKKAKSEIDKLSSVLNILGVDIKTLGISSEGFTSATRKMRRGVVDLFNEFKELVKTSEGLEQAKQRLSTISAEIVQTEKTLANVQAGRVQLTKKENGQLILHRDNLEAQEKILRKMITVGEEIVANQRVLEQNAQKIAELDQKSAESRQATVSSTAELLRATQALGIAAEDFDYLKAIKQQQIVANQVDELRQKQEQLNAEAKKFIATLQDTSAQQLAQQLIGQLPTLNSIATAEQKLNELRQQGRDIVAARQKAEQSGTIISEDAKQAEGERLIALAQQAEVTEQTLGFLRRILATKQEEKKETLDIRRLTNEQLQEQLELLRQNREANATTIGQIEKEIEARRRASELGRQALDFITQARQQIEQLNASSDLDRQIIQIRQQAQERVKMFGAQSDAAKVALQVETAQFRNLLAERLKGAKEFERELADLQIEDPLQKRLREIEAEFNERKRQLEEVKQATLNNNLLTSEDRKKKIEEIAIAEQNIANIRVLKEREVQNEIEKRIKTLQTELRLAQAPTNIQRELAELKLRFDRERKEVVGLGDQRERQIKLINAREVEEFKNTIAKFEDQLGELEAKRLKEFLLKFTVNGEIAFNVNDLLSDEFIDKLPRELQDAIKKYEGQVKTLPPFFNEQSVSLAQAFIELIGAADRGTADFLGVLVQFSQALESKDVVGAISAGIGLITGLFGSSRRRAEQERRRVEEQLRQQEIAAEEAAKRSRELIDALKELESALTGPEVTAQQLSASLGGAIGGLQYAFGFAENQIDTFATVLLKLRDLNIEPENFAQLFFQISQLAQFDPNAAVALELLRNIPTEMQETVFNLLSQLGIAIDGINNFGNRAASLSGILGDLQFEFDLFNVDDPIKQLDRFRAELKNKFGVELAGDVAGLRDFITKGFTALRQGGQFLLDFLISMNLEELTADELRDLLRALSDFAGKIDSNITPAAARSISDLLDAIERQFELFNISDPIRQLEILREQFQRQFKIELPRDVSGLRELVELGTQALFEGGEKLSRFLRDFDLGELTAEEFESLLAKFKNILEGFSFTSLRERLDLEFDLFNVDDPIQKLARLREAIRNQFGAIIPDTAQGLDEFIRTGLAAFLAGGEQLENFLKSLNLEELSREEFEDLLRELAGFRDELGSELEETGTTIQDKLSGLLDRLQLEFDLFNVDSPVDQLRRLGEEIKKEFNAVIPQTQEGIEQFLREGFVAIQNGEDAVLAHLKRLDLEELTVDQFEELLRRLASLADQAGAHVDEIDKAADEIRVSNVKGITLAVGNKQLDELKTIRVVATQILQELQENLFGGSFDLSEVDFTANVQFGEVTGALTVISEYQRGMLSQAVTTNRILTDILRNLGNGGRNNIPPVSNYFIMNADGAFSRVSEETIREIDRRLLVTGERVARTSGLV